MALIPVIADLITYIESQVAITAWDGEVPRFDLNQNPINPAATTGAIPPWPVFQVEMSDQGFNQDWQFEGAYIDLGPITVTVYGTSRSQVEPQLDTIHTLLNTEANQRNIPQAPTPTYYVMKLVTRRWCCVMEKGVRTSQSELLYRGELEFDWQAGSSSTP